jgi:hypothetical protein
MSFQGNDGELALDQIRTIDRSRLVRHLGALDPATAKTVVNQLSRCSRLNSETRPFSSVADPTRESQLAFPRFPPVKQFEPCWHPCIRPGSLFQDANRVGPQPATFGGAGQGAFA